ncbi:MAG: arylsulfatase [Traorella sp.]
MEQANILLLVCDQFRGDCLSFLNHPDVKTPYLDTLASKGVCFEKAYSSCPSCIPARAALFTGMSQAHHGRVGYEDGIDWNYSHMLAQEMRDGGYQTYCVGKMHVHPARKNCGFEGLRLHDGYLGYYRSSKISYYQHQAVTDDYWYYLRNQLGMQADFAAGGVECNSWVTHPWIYEERLHPTNWVVDESIRFLETRDRTRPFFLMSSFVRPHQPFDAPASYYNMYKGKALTPPAKGDWDDIEKTKQNGYIKDSIYGCNDEVNCHDAMAGYYASITHVDHQIGRLLTALKESGDEKNTVVIFVSDHGELLFDHHLYRKVFAYEGSSHVPLIISPGKNVCPIQPFKSQTLVELRDIMPTILDFANLEIPETVDGFSLVNEIKGQEKNNREYLHGEHSFHSKLSSHFIVTPTDKFVWYSETGKEQYFDLEKDPQETHNAIHDQVYQARINQLRNWLIEELNNREEGYSDGEKLIVGRKPLNNLSFIK